MLTCRYCTLAFHHFCLSGQAQASVFDDLGMKLTSQSTVFTMKSCCVAQSCQTQSEADGNVVFLEYWSWNIWLIIWRGLQSDSNSFTGEYECVDQMSAAVVRSDLRKENTTVNLMVRLEETQGGIQREQDSSTGHHECFQFWRHFSLDWRGRLTNRPT